MRIGITGGGPAGLYFALLMKKHTPAHQIQVLEQNLLVQPMAGEWSSRSVRCRSSKSVMPKSMRLPRLWEEKMASDTISYISRYFS